MSTENKTLRSLTPRQVYNLRRKSDKEQRLFQERNPTTANIHGIWQAAYSKGLLAGLNLKS